ncbi:FabD/lysophospholipase-like protein [Bimuria novae-zelandiae CBS 107.79]|uniref:FabD/lysophospholipase-like protein n=1 Tax=Bimuria novae-zelandiae CBS 107.79 TaxID=1447943 RepID=A0A6A5VD53_9PLEO|nr:FabD/lysophospholipase-like protein [Bimuria novae-zelandiae CBS 107.79]
MSTRVDLSLVRYSEVEKCYYFYDPQHPTAIQFAINGQWESWDVGWVKHHAHDPDIKQIATDAEAHLVRYSSTYQQWQTTPWAPMPPVASDGSNTPRRRTMTEPRLFSQEVASPLSASFSPIYLPTLDLPITPGSQSGPVFSPALHTRAIPRTHEVLHGTPSVSSEEYFLDLPPLRSPPAPSQPPASQPALALISPTAASPNFPPKLSSITTESLATSTSHAASNPHLMTHRVSVSVPPFTSAPDYIPTPPPTTHMSASKPTGRGRKRPLADLYIGEEDEAGREVASAVQNWDAGDHWVPSQAETPGHGTHRPDSTTIARTLPSAGVYHNIDPQLPGVEAESSVGPNVATNDVQTAPQSLSVNDYPPTSSEAPYCVTAPEPPGESLEPVDLQPRYNRDVKILLSLDGDGLRGLSQVFLVEALVDAICTKMNTNLEPWQIFDLIGGSSMGARQAYNYIAGPVFQNKKDFFSTFFSHAPPLAHDGQVVEDAIKTVVRAELSHEDEILYDSREDSADAFVVSTEIDIGSNKAALLRSYQSRRKAGPQVSDGMTVVQAMKAAVVAPRYMPPQNGVNWRPVIEPGLVDHGTAKNNPVLEMMYECRQLYNYINNMIIIVSIGTGIGLDQERESREMVRSVRARNAEAEYSNVKFQKNNEQLIEMKWMKFFRFNVPNLDDVPLEEWCHEDEVREKTSAYLADPIVGTSFHKCVADIAAMLTSAAKPSSGRPS